MEPFDIRVRLRDLNTKAYYLLVALSFLYFRQASAPVVLKFAIGLTAAAAVIPLRDYGVDSESWLRLVRWFKVVCLSAAFLSTVWWVIWT